MEQNKENKIEEKTKTIMESEPVKRLLEIEQTAVVTGRVEGYEGQKLPYILRQALHEVGEQEYTKGFNDGANLTGRMSEEVTADKIEQARQEERK